MGKICSRSVAIFFKKEICYIFKYQEIRPVFLFLPGIKNAEVMPVQKLDISGSKSSR